ncbi:Disease resistance protein RGA2 [Rhynchospora pubera]|uniref:Disease resistance protein RGA2 n=1 Tax=Rhynchospora pubera TaxID=906938 RepID=A0AAV8C9K6_9POAL|nr:Disease resistance protein RGA2 [Rhynchospora pubera]
MHGLLNQFSSAVVGNIGAFVGAFMGEIVSKGSSFIIDKYRKYTLVNEKLETIEQLLPKIKSAIEESERRWITNEQLLQWLKTLIHAAYQADYVLETFNYRRMLEIEEKARNKITTVNTNGRNYIQSPHNIAKRIRTSYNCAKRMVMDDEEITQLGSVLQRLERAIYDVSEFRKLLEKCEVTVPRALRTPLYMEKGRVFSRQVEMERIINFLFLPSTRDDQRVDILPLLGDEGMGKTTLALHACNNERVRNHFSFIIFISVLCVETKKDLVLVLRKILDQLCCNHSLLFEEDLFELQWLIKQKLKKEKFLIVLDDVLQVDQITRSVLHDYLSCGKEGSKVIAASPSKEAVIKFDTVEPIELMGFQKEEYWFFFRDHAFGSAKPEHHPKLAIIGREIAKRMQGSPLAAKIIGKLLRDKLSAQHWVNVLKVLVEHRLWASCTVFDICSLFLKLMPGHPRLLRVSYGPCLGGNEIRIDNLEEELISGPFSKKRENRGTMGPEGNRLRVLVAKTDFPTNCCMYHTFEMEACSSY